MTLVQATGLLLVLLPTVFNLLFIMLQRMFEYPDILRKPADHVLLRFQVGGRRLVAVWYCFMLAAVMFVPLVVMVSLVLAEDDILWLPIATTIGVTAGVVQFVGLARWSFLMPFLARTYLNPDSDSATRNAVSVVFEATNRYVGTGLGEHLGYLFTGVWTAMIGVAMTQSRMFDPLLGWVALIPAVAILVGLFELAGIKSASRINAIGYIVWSIWLIVSGVTLLIR